MDSERENALRDEMIEKGYEDTDLTTLSVLVFDAYPSALDEDETYALAVIIDLLQHCQALCASCNGSGYYTTEDYDGYSEEWNCGRCGGAGYEPYRETAFDRYKQSLIVAIS